MNKLLKVLEDRKVFLESSYYSSEDSNIPSHIHEIFQKGLPADFRLVGATTRNAEDISPALRSRCVELFFRPLYPNEIAIIAKKASLKGGFRIENNVDELVSKYAQNGRDAVNIIQMAGGIALVEGRNTILKKDIEWVIEFGHYSPRIDKKACATEQIGCMNGLAVLGSSTGMIIDIEVSAIRAKSEKGIIKITGIVEEEEIDGRGHKIKMISSAKASVENALTVLRRYLDVDCREYDIHLNFPGGVPIDGPSAGIAIAVALYSAILNIPVNGDLAMTGELSIRGKVKPVGGVTIKLETAKQAGIKKVIIPKENWQELYNDMGISVIPVDNIAEVLDITFNRKVSNLNDIIIKNSPTNIISATS